MKVCAFFVGIGAHNLIVVEGVLLMSLVWPPSAVSMPLEWGTAFSALVPKVCAFFVSHGGRGLGRVHGLLRVSRLRIGHLRGWGHDRGRLGRVRHGLLLDVGRLRAGKWGR